MMLKSSQTCEGKPLDAMSAAASPLLSQLFGDAHISQPGSGAKLTRVRKNKDVLVAGNRSEFVYANHDGWLFRYKILHNGRRQIMDFILPGQIFGLQACLFGRSLYSVATIIETSLSAIPIGMINNMFEQNLRLSKALFWSAVCEGAILGEHLTDAARRSAYERVSHLLLELFMRLHAVRLTEGMRFLMPLTQELIGDALGLTTVHVNRTLRSLRTDKLIMIDGQLVTILDFEALSLLSDFENSYLGEHARTVRNGLRSSKEGGLPQRSNHDTPVKVMHGDSLSRGLSHRHSPHST
jgi:CRP-like cAMP-binding protein